MMALLGYVDAASLADELERSRRSGGGYITRCPSHDDGTASLSIHDGKKGTVLNCHAGCSAKQICQDIGIRMAQLFEDYSEGGQPTTEVDMLLRQMVERTQPPKLRQDRYSILNIVDLAFKGTVEDSIAMYLYNTDDYLETEFEQAWKQWGITADVVVRPYMERYLKSSGQDWFEVRDEAMKALRAAYKEEIS
jgi:hypothetical protein